MRAVVIAVWAMVVAGCGGPRLLVRDASVRDVEPPLEGRARVVFAVPGSLRDVIGIVDERGRPIGQLGGRTFMSIDAEPGNRRFYALVDASAWVVEGTVEPNRTYWVVAEAGLGRPFRWVAWVPDCEADPRTRLRGVRAVEPDPDADPEIVRRQLGNIPQRILEADEELDEMSRVEREAHTLRPACDRSASATAE